MVEPPCPTIVADCPPTRYSVSSSPQASLAARGTPPMRPLTTHEGSPKRQRGFRHPLACASGCLACLVTASCSTATPDAGELTGLGTRTTGQHRPSPLGPTHHRAT